MRIALFPSAYYPAVGGVEELTRNLARELTARGHIVEVWVPGAQESVGNLDGITIRRLPLTLPPARLGALARAPLAMTRAAWRVMECVRSFRPEIIHVQCFSVNGAYATFAGWATRTPLVLSLQGETVMDDHDIYAHSWAMRTALRMGLRVARATTACSKFVLDDAARFGAGEDGVVIPNGFHVQRVNGQHPAPRRYVLGVGRVVSKKGFDLLVRAFAHVQRQLDDCDLVIAGAGPELDNLRGLALDLGVRLTTPGAVGRSELADLLRGASVFVMPSRVEPFGIVILEAWAAEVPVVVSRRGGAPEFVVNEVTGLLVDPFDEQAMSAAILRVLNDASLALRLSRAGQAATDSYSWSKIASRYESVYASASQSARAAR